jgi:hypothetical protein
MTRDPPALHKLCSAIIHLLYKDYPNGVKAFGKVR